MMVDERFVVVNTTLLTWLTVWGKTGVANHFIERDCCDAAGVIVPALYTTAIFSVQGKNE